MTIAVSRRLYSETSEISSVSDLTELSTQGCSAAKSLFCITRCNKGKIPFLWRRAFLPIQKWWASVLKKVSDLTVIILVYIALYDVSYETCKMRLFYFNKEVRKKHSDEPPRVSAAAVEFNAPFGVVLSGGMYSKWKRKGAHTFSLRKRNIFTSSFNIKM